jgi:hypothetical protein
MMMVILAATLTTTTAATLTPCHLDPRLLPVLSLASLVWVAVVSRLATQTASMALVSGLATQMQMASESALATSASARNSLQWCNSQRRMSSSSPTSFPSPNHTVMTVPTHKIRCFHNTR